MVDPVCMCRQHLLGEHLECHMFLGAMERGKSLRGYVGNGLFDVRVLQGRHDALAAEMVNRGYVHRSPLVVDSTLLRPEWFGDINGMFSLSDLANRCSYCASLVYLNVSAGLKRLPEEKDD